MKRFPFPLFWIVWLSLCFAAAAAAQTGASCPYCGMEKAKFGHSWVEITYDDGTTKGFCSVHCAAIDMAVHTEKVPETVRVGDYETQEMIDAETAHWVIGGDRMGVMTTRAKWAFGEKARADHFMAEHGGTPADYPEVLHATFADMYKDIRMIQEKRKERRKRRSSSDG